MCAKIQVKKSIQVSNCPWLDIGINLTVHTYVDIDIIPTVQCPNSVQTKKLNQFSKKSQGTLRMNICCYCKFSNTFLLLQRTVSLLFVHSFKQSKKMKFRYGTGLNTFFLFC